MGPWSHGRGGLKLPNSPSRGPRSGSPLGNLRVVRASRRSPGAQPPRVPQAAQARSRPIRTSGGGAGCSPPPRDARFSLLSRYWWTGAASAMWAGPARLHQWRRTRSRPPARGSMAWRQLRVSGAVGSARGRRVLAGVAGWVGPGTERVPGADRHRRGPG